MDDFRKFSTNKRQIINFNNVMELSGSKQFICIDKGVLAIMRYLLNTRGSWRTTYRVSYVDKIGYMMPTEAQFNELLNLIGEANVDMSTCDEIVTALNGIASQIASRAGYGSGSGCCVVGGDTDITDVNDNSGENIPGGAGTPPPGFSTMEEYEDYKCDAANWIFDQYIGTLRNWAALSGTLGGLTIAVIAGLLLLTVPPLGLTLILSALGVLVGIDFLLLGALSDIADEMETNRDDTVCQIYGSGSTSVAAGVLQTAAQTAISSLSLDPEATFMVITDNLASNQGMEVLITRTEEIVGYGGDCSGCDAAQIIQIIPWSGQSATVLEGEFLIGQTTVVQSVASTSLLGATRENMVLDGGGFDRVIQIIDVQVDSGLTTIRVNMPGNTDNDFAPASLIGMEFTAEAFHFINVTNPGDSLQSFTMTFVATNP